MLVADDDQGHERSVSGKSQVQRRNQLSIHAFMVQGI